VNFRNAQFDCRTFQSTVPPANALLAPISSPQTIGNTQGANSNLATNVLFALVLI